MIRILAAAAVFATVALARSASAQTWGQPVYLDAWGRPVGGTPLSEVETRSYAGTGRWADGYSDRPIVHVPAPGHGRPYGPSHGYRGHDYDAGYGRHGYGYGYRYRYRPYRHEPASRSGYRDEWGYNDDRPPSARRGGYDRRSHRLDRDCGCGDVYFYDR